MTPQPRETEREIGSPANSSNGVQSAASTQKRTVCDHCRRRRIRCDGQFPCHQCLSASLTCKRDHVPRKRGPKRGHGRVINELRARESGKDRTSRESSVDFDIGTDDGPKSTATSVPSTPPDISWHKVASDPRNATEPQSIFTSDQYHPVSRSYHYLIPQCVELYYEHIYPIMPLLYMPTIRDMVTRPMEAPEKNLVYALCALTCFHMSGKSVQASQAAQAAGPDSWDKAGRFFLDECLSTRQSYDFLEDLSLFAVISSFWLSTSFFEINQSRKSWVYLREALTLAQDMGIHDDSTYAGLGPEEKLCRQRVFWQLFVTERSFAVLRNKPITLKKTPSLPTTRHPYESPEIHSGFLQLISSYVPLDESFVTAWNEGSDPHISAATYLALQDVLSVPPAFLSRSRPSTPFSDDASTLSHLSVSPTLSPISTLPFNPAQPLVTRRASVRDEASAAGEDQQPEPTAIQKADLLVTQQWLRLIVWQSSFRQGLLSWAASHESMHFAFPLTIARRTASILQTVPSTAVEVHGMGIFEKIFEIGTWCINVLGAYDSAVSSGTPITGAGTPAGLGMDFVGNELGVLGVGRKGSVVDPLEFFVRTLSASPNSRTQFAERLLLFAGQRPGGMKMALSPAPESPDLVAGTGARASWSGSRSPVGTVLGELKEEAEEDARAQDLANLPEGYSMDAYGHPLVDPLAHSITSSIAGSHHPALVSPDLTTPYSAWSNDGFPHSGQSFGDEVLLSPGVASVQFPFSDPGSHI
ncbi:hypothetical protein GQ53DRAFT_754538 [Thozetella sp. PMI_491]|nr:hypothetical protein GQ53DRAFT_754538 [Thozetella sp. PMI_491]